MEERLYEAAINGNGNSLGEEDEPVLDRAVMACFNWNPLHLAASRGNTEYFVKLLSHSPELAEALDSHQRSALHLASAKGHIEIVKAITKVSPELCLVHDRDGANPLHVAAMKGMVEVLDELFEANPHAARVRLDKGETVLHLCVKYNQLKFLELLLLKIKGEEFVNAKDDAGNTILHLAVADKRFEIIKHVLNNTEIEVNETNASKQTAMDILLLGQSKGTKPEGLDNRIEDFLREADAKRAKDLVQVEWLAEKRDALMIVAILLATMAFQAGVSPPGGVWPDNSNGHRAGETVMAYNYPELYPYFLRSNTIGFVASLSTILFLISELPFKRKGFMWILVVIMWLTITSMAFTYAFSIVVITPKWRRKALSRTIVVAVIVWCSVMAILLIVHTGRLIANILEVRRSRDKARKRIFRFGTGRWSRGTELKPRHNPVQEYEAHA